MARPLYENQATLEKERTLAKQLVDSWACELGKLPIRYGIDYAFLRNGEVVGFAELKCRAGKMHAYPSYMISLGKIMSARMLHRVTNVPIVLAVEWQDRTGWVTLAGKGAPEYRVSMGGRRDRNDAQDIEPVALIPIDKFRRL